jgi:hypothetical protein
MRNRKKERPPRGGPLRAELLCAIRRRRSALPATSKEAHQGETAGEERECGGKRGSCDLDATKQAIDLSIYSGGEIQVSKTLTILGLGPEYCARSQGLGWRGRGPVMASPLRLAPPPKGPRGYFRSANAR